MYLSIIDKFILVIKYFFSSFLGIEMFIVSLLIFLFLLFNLKYKNSIVKIGISIFLVVIMLFISGGFHTYVKDSINSFIKLIMNYYYFPSLALYYIIALISIIILIYTIINDKISNIKRCLNYTFLSLFFMFFIGLVSYIIKNKIRLVLDYSLYQDDLILSFIQISNFIFLIWIFITGFWYLYSYFKRKFD